MDEYIAHPSCGFTASTGLLRDLLMGIAYVEQKQSLANMSKSLPVLFVSGGEDPVPEMASALRHLEACGADCIIMPCNTAHYFLPRLQAMTKIPFLSILTAAAEACKAQFPGKTVGILATRGTLAANLYQEALAQAGVPYLVPDAPAQDALMRVIYDGVKAGKGPDSYRADFLTVLEQMSAGGAEVFLLGCTELPLAAEALNIALPTVDPTAELAKASIRFCGYGVRGE